MFRGKESSNRIELSRLVQDLLNFGVLGSLRLWGGGRWVGGIWGHGGCPPTHTCMHAHAHTHIYTCIEIANGHRHGGIHVYHVYNMFNMHVHAYMHVCACMHVWDTPPHTHTHPHPHAPICHPPRGVDPQNHLKFDNTSTYQDISIHV